MASLPDHLFQELTDALQVLAVVSTHLRRTTSGTMERSWRPTAPEADHVVHQGVQDRLPEGRLSGAHSTRPAPNGCPEPRTRGYSLAQWR